MCERFRVRVRVWCSSAVFAVFVAACLSGRSQGLSTTVRKKAGEGDANPALCVTSFRGSDAAQQAFLRILRKSDWFTVVSTKEKAVYTLDCAVAEAPTVVMEMRVTERAGGGGGTVRVTGQRMTDRFIYRAVDQLIEGVFKNPGPCSSQIAFAVAGAGSKEVFVCNFDGTGAKQVTHNRSISTEPSWGPNASSLVYTLYESNATSVVLIDMLRQRQRRLSLFPGLNAGADLSPDGRWAALCLSRDRRVELYLLDVQSGRVRRLTNDSAVESSPCWSPDGRRICYVSDRAGRPQLYIINASGGKPARVLHSAEETVSPAWSPVSNTICFSTRMGAHYALATIDMSKAGAEKKVVTRAAGDWESPSWAPDGRHVVCSRTLNGQSGLCMVDTWYQRVLPITKPARHSLPSWSDAMQ